MLKSSFCILIILFLSNAWAEKQNFENSIETKKIQIQPHSAIKTAIIANSTPSANLVLQSAVKTDKGYDLIGQGFGNSAAQIKVYEINTLAVAGQLDAQTGLPESNRVRSDLILQVTDTRISTASKPGGTTIFQVVLGNQKSKFITAGFGYPMTQEIAFPIPEISGLRSSINGYEIIGRGFGNDRSKVKVYQMQTTDIRGQMDSQVGMPESAAIPDSAITEVTEKKIAVSLRPPGTIVVQVVVAGKKSKFNAGGVSAPPFAIVIAEAWKNNKGDFLGYLLKTRNVNCGNPQVPITLFEDNQPVDPKKLVCNGDDIYVMNTAVRGRTIKHKIRRADQETSEVSATYP